VKVPIIFQSYRSETPTSGFWDYIIIEDLISGRLGRPVTGYEFVRYEGVNCPIPIGTDVAIIVLAARHHADPIYSDRLNKDMASLRGVALFLLGDEENAFPVHLIHHPNIRIWRMMARPDSPFVHHCLPNGYTPHTHLLDSYDVAAVDRPLDWFLAGQITHLRREQCVEQLRRIPGGMRVETDGFTKGLPPAEYMRMLASAKIAPCPSGPQSPDTFRLYEALEAGCVPIADAQTSKPGFPNGYWQWIFGCEVPFPVVSDWATLPEVMARELAAWPENQRRIAEWWRQYKQKLALDLEEDIQQLQGATQ